MPNVNYIANGFCREATPDNKKHGLSEFRFFNPTPQDTTVDMTLYFSDKEPVKLPPLEVGAEKNPFSAFPWQYPEQTTNCGAWGLKIVSPLPLMVEHIFCAGIEGKDKSNIKYNGGVCDTLALSRLSRLWYFTDGLRLIHADIEKTSKESLFPYHEFEWYHILNPNKSPAHVKMQCLRGDGKKDEHLFTIAPERVLFFDNFDMYTTYVDYAIRFVSDQPIAVASERMIYGLYGVDEWGAHIHCPRPGLPAPLPWNEEDTL